MPGTWSKLVTVVTGQTITAALWNNEFDNVITNATPAGTDDDSANLAAMQGTTDPYPAASESLATSLSGEIRRLRYLIGQITGEAQWYIDPDTTLTALSYLITLIASSTTQVKVPDGSAANPSYSFASANNDDNGMYLSAANVVSWAAAGVLRMSLSASALTMALPIAMATNKITGLGAATADGDATRWEQLGVRGAPVRASVGATATNSTGTFADSGITGNITPSSATSRVLVIVSINIRLDLDATEEMVCDCNIVRDSTEVALFRRCSTLKGNNNDSRQSQVSFAYIDSPATTSATTYKVQFRRNASSATGTIRINDSTEENSHITLAEIK